MNGLEDPGNRSERCRLAGTVGADERQTISRLQREGNVAQRLDNNLVAPTSPDFFPLNPEKEVVSSMSETRSDRPGTKPTRDLD